MKKCSIAFLVLSVFYWNADVLGRWVINKKLNWEGVAGVLMRKDRKTGKNMGWSCVSNWKLLLCDGNFICTESLLILIKLWENYYLYEFLYVLNSDVRRPKSLTYLESPVRSVPTSASLSLWSPFLLSRLPWPLCCTKDTSRCHTLGSLHWRFSVPHTRSVPHMSEWRTSSWNLHSSVVSDSLLNCRLSHTP